MRSTLTDKFKYQASLTLLLLVFGLSKVHAGENLEIMNEIGISIPVDKKEFPVIFRCREYPNDKFWFSIRRSKSDPTGLLNAWMVFSDKTGYQGSLYRNGLDWRFDWTDDSTAKRFSLVVKSGNQGYYYNWSLADDEGRMSVARAATCE